GSLTQSIGDPPTSEGPHRMLRLRASVMSSVGVAVAAALMLAGCSPGGIRLRSGSDSLPPCHSSQYGVVGVEEIVELPLECDQGGIIIRFPDGLELEAPAVGSSVGQMGMREDPQYILINLGMDGLFAARWVTRRLEMWGSPGALELALEGHRSWYARYPA